MNSADYSTKTFLQALDESTMPVSAKLIRDSLLNGTYHNRRVISEATADITDISLVKEPKGYGVSVKQADGHEYRYAASDSHDKYDTPEKLLAAAQKLVKFRPAGAVLGWLDRNSIMYYGSKRGQNKDYPAESVQIPVRETLSKETQRELENLIKELHPEFSSEDVKDAAFAFLEDFGIESDRDYYRVGPNKLKRALQ